jgi:multiple sugar transport system permease protein
VRLITHPEPGARSERIARQAPAPIEANQESRMATTTLVARRPGGRLKWRNTLLGWSFILPNFIGFAVLTLVPVIALFYIAFTDWNAFGTAKLVGLDNFTRLLADHSVRIALANTVYYTAFHIPLTLGLSLALALLLNRKMRGVAFFRTAAFFPYVTSIVAIAVVWNMLFSPEFGPINQFLTSIGISHPPGWTTSSTWAMPAVIIVGTWREMGYYMLLFLAGLQTIPPELYEAARVDGGSSTSPCRACDRQPSSSRSCSRSAASRSST